ncbi:hypothetical protein FLAG1_07316 [Fusarium langsethiae]|uniref:Uncharacterized protein n=1 Tax=Fusarium langsethiae TaxID=179993 RepID=A0A0M9EUA9_FUSLA|nr:hypothetical protein FLAG1_07316 [Fusarium langsethiae]GKU05357.1 unnamed protein product [Fusarium langsethiae]GKU21976.1 unnamed protein product [Fusarium langsethiae]
MSRANNNDENTYDQPQPTSSPERDVPSWLEGISTDERAIPQGSLLPPPDAFPGRATLTPRTAAALANHVLFITKSLGDDNNDDDNRTVAKSVKSDSSQSVDQIAYITSISGHTVDSTTCTVELNTVWSDGSWSWNPEIDVQKSVPDVVYRY